MENVEIKFINQDTDQEIIIKMHYDNIEKTLDYDTVVVPELSDESGGLALFLADMFLNMLNDKSQDNIDSSEVNAN